MSAGLAGCGLLQRITVRPFGADRALVSATLPHVRLAGLWARRGADGRIRLEPPKVSGSDGRQWPAYALQPGFAEQIAAAVATSWARADAAGGR
jgi:hypothetical protein